MFLSAFLFHFPEEADAGQGEEREGILHKHL